MFLVQNIEIPEIMNANSVFLESRATVQNKKHIKKKQEKREQDEIESVHIEK